MLCSRDAPASVGAFFLWKNDKGDDIICVLDFLIEIFLMKFIKN